MPEHFPGWIACERLSGCRRIFVEGLVLSARIGILDSEQAAPQRLCFDIDVWVEDRDAREDIGQVFDIRNLRRAAENALGSSQVLLHETVADRAITELLAYPGVRAVRVRTSKPDIDPDAAGCGVETFRYA